MDPRKFHQKRAEYLDRLILKNPEFNLLQDHPKDQYQTYIPGIVFELGVDLASPLLDLSLDRPVERIILSDIVTPSLFKLWAQRCLRPANRRKVLEKPFRILRNEVKISTPNGE